MFNFYKYSFLFIMNLSLAQKIDSCINLNRPGVYTVDKVTIIDEDGSSKEHSNITIEISKPANLSKSENSDVIISNAYIIQGTVKYIENNENYEINFSLCDEYKYESNKPFSIILSNSAINIKHSLIISILSSNISHFESKEETLDRDSTNEDSEEELIYFNSPDGFVLFEPDELQGVNSLDPTSTRTDAIQSGSGLTNQPNERERSMVSQEHRAKKRELETKVVASEEEPQTKKIRSAISLKNDKKIWYHQKLENLSPEFDKWIQSNVHFEEQYDILYTTNPLSKFINDFTEVIVYNALLENLKVDHTIVLINKANIVTYSNILIITITKNNELDNYTFKLYKKDTQGNITLKDTFESKVYFSPNLINGVRRLVVKISGITSYIVENFYIIGELSNKIEIDLSSTKPETSTSINDSHTPKVDFTMTDLLEDQFKSKDYSSEYYEKIPFESKIKALTKFIPQCNTDDLLVFIHNEFIKNPNIQGIDKRLKVGLILKVIDTLENGDKIFQIKYIKQSKVRSKFSIEDPHISCKISFYKTSNNKIAIYLLYNSKRQPVRITSYQLVLNSTQGKNLLSTVDSSKTLMESSN